MTKETYYKDTTRLISLSNVKAWAKGENAELKKLIEFGFENTIFISKDGRVCMYYNYDEAEKFYNVIEKRLTDRFFEYICDRFYVLIDHIDKANTNTEIINLLSKMLPILCIFAELDGYPELGTEDMKRRLLRIRETTEAESYKLTAKLKVKDEPKDFIYFQNKLYVLKDDN